jgi:hypothetical protein
MELELLTITIEQIIEPQAVNITQRPNHRGSIARLLHAIPRSLEI